MMTDYGIFGSCLRSAIAFPELRPIDNEAPRWTLRVAEQPPFLTTPELLGGEDIGDGTNVRLYSAPEGYRLEYDDGTGVFDVAANGEDITWCPGTDPEDEMVRLHIMGRVLATALHAVGMYCLHGSGVVLGDEAVGFVAPRFWGKSTLALAVAKAGGRILSDDTLAMHPDDEALHLWPGVHSVRLWGDSAERIAGEDPEGGAPHFEVKRTFTRFPDGLLACRPVPLSALYFLAPHQGNGGEPLVQRTPVRSIQAALALVAHAKIGALLGGSEAPRLFERAVRVASRVPVYRLDFPRDYAHISSVVARLNEWHARPARRAALAR
jgi:hypothetical protein